MIFQTSFRMYIVLVIPFPSTGCVFVAIVNIILAQCVDFDCLSVSRSQTEFLRQ